MSRRYPPRARRSRKPRPLWRIGLDATMVVALAAGLLAAAGLLDRFGITGGAKVIDGDSLRLDGEEIRLHAIDAPEYHQDCTDATGASYACGRKARDYLASLVRGKKLNCTVVDRDRYGRSVAECRAGEIDINRAMVEAGWAVAYLRHSVAYGVAEAAARKARRGIWQGNFTSPEAWRAQHRATFDGNSPSPD